MIKVLPKALDGWLCQTGGFDHTDNISTVMCCVWTTFACFVVMTPPLQGGYLGWVRRIDIILISTANAWDGESSCFRLCLALGVVVLLVGPLDLCKNKTRSL